MKKYILFSIIVFSALWVFSSASAESATINAASCSLADVQTALNSVTTGDTVIVPSGVCAWSSALSIPDSKKITLQGAGKTSTIITGQVAALPVVIRVGLSGSRITQIGFKEASIALDGDGARVDHCKMEFASWAGAHGIQIYTSRVGQHVTALIDNNEFVNVRILNSGGPVLANHALWAQPLGLGTFNAAYIEDNTFTAPDNRGNAIDGNYGMRVVFRFNNVDAEYLEIHSMQQGRGSRSWEIYGNILNGRTDEIGWRMPMRPRGGTGVIFDNILTGTWSGKVIYADNVRTINANWEGGKCDGTNTQGYDGNAAGGHGYPCRDQIGTSYDTVQWSPGSTNTQTKAPAYEWNNVYNPGAENVTWFVANGADTYHIWLDRDIYAETGSFTGASGMGRGTLANRPATCTTGVAYWATDVGEWNSNQAGNDGQLYKCTATNTWTFYYKPYTYPHPLRGGVQPQTCGNNVREGTETCDGTDLAGQTCVSRGFSGGTLACNSQCSGFVTTGCTSSQYFLPEQIVQAESGTLSGMQTGISGSDTYVYASTDNTGSVSFTFNIQNPGQYKMEARVNNNNDGGQNSFYVGLDNEPAQGNVLYTYNIFPLTSGFIWDDVSKWGNGQSGNPPISEFDPIIWDLTQGTHTFTFYGRESNTWLDQIILKRVVTDTTPPAAPTGVVVS